ncbi:MAG: cytochrome c biogenesis protein ResB [Deltaproteobacteria bacterium]|nr:cytochrome c biogenesis protein ResB [Deltaproteobacteria bacterium]
MKTIWRFFSSVTLTVILAILIVIDSIWGSLIVKNNPEIYRGIDQIILLPWLFKYGIKNLQMTLWIFILISLIFLFAINVFVCTVDKLYSILKNKLPIRTFFPHIVHIGFLIALFGHLVGSLYGFRNPVIPVMKGEVVSILQQKNISIRFDDMDVKLSKTGMPTELKIMATLFENGKEILMDNIQINRPLLYKGIAFYYADHSETPAGIVLKIGDERFSAKFNSSFTAKDGASFKLGAIIPDFAMDEKDSPYSRSNEFRNPAQEIIVSRDGKTAKGWLVISRPGSKTTIDGYDIELADYIMTQYVVMTINKDPGIIWIIIGSLMLTIGMFLLLFFRGERAELIPSRS